MILEAVVLADVAAPDAAARLFQTAAPLQLFPTWVARGHLRDRDASICPDVEGVQHIDAIQHRPDSFCDILLVLVGDVIGQLDADATRHSCILPRIQGRGRRSSKTRSCRGRRLVRPEPVGASRAP